MRLLTMPAPADIPAGPSIYVIETDGPVMRPLTTAVDRAASFTQLAEKHLDAAYSLAAVILGNRNDAQDATHDAIVKAWRAWPSLRSVDAFTPWFQRILVNSCRDRLRRRNRLAQFDGPRPSQPMDHELPARDRDPYARTAERDALEGALHRLSADERIVVVLRYFLDLPIEAIAVRLDVPVGTVKSRLHRAITHLRAAYDAVERNTTEALR